MRLIDDIKIRLKKIADKTPEFKDEAVDKIKKLGDEGLGLTREFVGEISDKFSDITAITRLQYNVKELKIALNKAYLELGKTSFSHHKKGAQSLDDNKVFLAQIEKVADLKKQVDNKSIEYDKLKKERSDNYVVNKLSDELNEAGAVIDQGVVSEKSNVIGKLLKEVLLPKEALITAIKRKEQIIIPDGKTELMIGDLVTIVGKREDVKKLIKRLNSASKIIKKD